MPEKAQARAVVIGCKTTTRYLFEQLRPTVPVTGLVTISPDKAGSQRVAGYDDLSDLAGETDLYVAKRYALDAAEDQAFFDERRFDMAFVAGWQRLIPDAVLATFRCGAFGMHGSALDLPFGRGRSPMNWSLIEGRGWFFTNLFRYLPGADDGPVVDTACFSIQPTDDAETLHFKNLLAMVELVRRNFDAIADGSAEFRPQPDAEPTYYPKREPEDGLIDWGADVLAIERFIRAVAPPFAGAFSFIEGRKLTIRRAALFYTDLESHPFHDQAPGTVCAVLTGGKFCLRCIGGVLIVHDYDLDGTGTPSPGDRMVSPAESIRVFPRNRHGNFDMPAKA